MTSLICLDTARLLKIHDLRRVGHGSSPGSSRIIFLQIESPAAIVAELANVDAAAQNSSGLVIDPPTMSVDSVIQDPELLRRLLRAKDRMDAASQEHWPVPRLARVSRVSAAHFARSFKQAFGVPPHRYLLTRRIERATAQLRDTDRPITEIAFDTGWESLGTFGRTYRAVTGESPGTIRTRARAAARELDRVPACFVSAAHRPDLTIAVSEKLRREATDINRSEQKETS
jgi:AraC-like DNA-binding protein